MLVVVAVSTVTRRYCLYSVLKEFSPSLSFLIYMIFQAGSEWDLCD